MEQRKNSIVRGHLVDERKSRRDSCRLGSPENVPVESDYPRPNSVSQKIWGGAEGFVRVICRRFSDGAGVVSVLFILFNWIGLMAEATEHRVRSVANERSASGSVLGRQEQESGRAGKAVWSQSVVASAPLARDGSTQRMMGVRTRRSASQQKRIAPSSSAVFGKTQPVVTKSGSWLRPGCRVWYQ